MSDKTGISWTDATWNPIRGCSRVSEGCRNCYAEAMAGRCCDPGQPYEGLVKLVVKEKVLRRDFADGRVELSKRETRETRWTGEVRFVADHLSDPLRWRRPRKIFVNSMSDLFHESLTNEQIAAVFGVMATAPRHTFQVLTKRARRMREWFEWVDLRCEHGLAMFPNDDKDWRARQMLFSASRRAGVELPHHHGGAWPLPNVWLGVSVENQAAADERIPELLRTPSALRFLSCEPLLGPLDVSPHLGPMHWVITGCESGAGARPCDVEWLRSLRDQCAEADVPFFLKQAKEPPFVDDREDPREVGYPSGPPVAPTPDPIGFGSGSKRKLGGIIELPYLDGVQHAAFPKEV